MTDKIAIISDTHFGIKNDVLYMLDYQEKFYKNEFFPYILKNGIKTIIHAGDLFDRRKYINFNTLMRTKKMFLDILLENDIKMYIIPGNHDVYAKNTNEVNSLDMLLKEYPNVIQLHEPIVKNLEGTNFLFLPWINMENYQSSMEFVATNSADILVGHLELSGFEMYAGVKNDHGMDKELFSKFDQVWSGHFHHKSQKDNISYLGAPMEFTFADCNDPRGFHVFDCQTKELTFHQNPHKIYEKFYYDDSTKENQKIISDYDVSNFEGKIVRLVVSKKTNTILFENFVDRIYKHNLVDLTIIHDMSEFIDTEEDLEELKDKSTKELMDSYVDGINTEMDNAKLKSMLNSIYIEALNSNYSSV